MVLCWLILSLKSDQFQSSPAASTRNITSMKNLTFHRLLMMVILPVTFLLRKVGRMYFLNLGVRLVLRVRHRQLFDKLTSLSPNSILAQNVLIYQLFPNYVTRGHGGRTDIVVSTIAGAAPNSERRHNHAAPRNRFDCWQRCARGGEGVRKVVLTDTTWLQACDRELTRHQCWCRVHLLGNENTNGSVSGSICLILPSRFLHMQNS